MGNRDLAKLVLSTALAALALRAGPGSSAAAASDEAIPSWPKDATPYSRALVAGESPQSRVPLLAGIQAAGSSLFPSVLVVDTVVANTDANLATTDTFNDGETSIAVNPADRDEIVISSFSNGWTGPGTNATFYHSTDGGMTWTQQGVPPPPGWVNTGCPCDWAWDWGAGDALSGTILAVLTTGFDVVGVTTTDATSPAAFSYNGNPAQRTNNNVAGSFTNADQPWLLVNEDPLSPTQDNVYVAWDDFNNTDGISGVDMRVAVSAGGSPLDFTLDRQVGNAVGGVNPGLRLADNRGDGTMWALWGRNVGAGAGGSKNMDYMLNRSTDGGSTWTLNGDPNLPTTAGIVVANADSTQPTPKFGTVNALLGGVHHAAVDPNTGDLYYVYGNRDSGTGNNRLAIRRVTDAGGGNVAVGAESFVTGQVDAAIPQVAVLDDGTVGVFYYTSDGIDVSGFPQFTAHLAVSTNQGATFTDATLLTFLSSATDNGNVRQRVLGDYMQMKALGNCFFGSFTGNGAAFGRSISNHDPIFFKTCGGAAPVAQCQDVTVEAGASCKGVATPADVDDGSFDPDGGPVSLALSPPGPYSIGTTPVDLVVTDEDGLQDMCSADVTVTVTPPAPLTPEADTYARRSDRNTNEGASTFLSVGDSRNVSFVAFDGLNPNANLQCVPFTARLRFTILKVEKVSLPGGRLCLNRMLIDWTEGNGFVANSSGPPSRGTGAGATYYCATDSQIENRRKNCVVPWDLRVGRPNPWVAAPTDCVQVTTGQTGVIEFDVTTDVAAFLAGTPNYGWAFRKDSIDNARVLLGSRESATPPQLIIDVP